MKKPKLYGRKSCDTYECNISILIIYKYIYLNNYILWKMVNASPWVVWLQRWAPTTKHNIDNNSKSTLAERKTNVLTKNSCVPAKANIPVVVLVSAR